jgi:predicted metal-dependent HD superfamily phosphohydrolase
VNNDPSLPLTQEPLFSRDKAISHLTKLALFRINEQYGAKGKDPKPYHGIEHTLWVMNAAYSLALLAAQNGNLPANQVELALINGAFHDVVHNDGALDNEKLSAQMAAFEMEATGVFSSEEISIVANAIPATTVISVENDRIIQAVEGRGYLGILLADADLSTFGAPLQVYWDSAQRFFAETNPGVPLRGEAFRQFAQRQVRVVSNHRYHTEEARTLYSNQPEIIDFLTAQLAAF